jgi:hypothetical protein
MHAARCAIRHCERAIETVKVDKEMAVFRAVTGEEEAARAIFHSLQRHRYPHSELLNWTNHVQKNAVVPFCTAVARALGFMARLKPQVTIREGESRIRIRLTIDREDGQPDVSFPDPPLHGILAIGSNDPGFHSQLQTLAEELGDDSLDAYLRGVANIRNTVLYATDRGVPMIKGDPTSVIADKRKNVFSLLCLYLLIDQTRQHQSLVVAALDSFVRIVPGLRHRFDEPEL